MPLAVIAGLMLALVRQYGPKVFAWFASIYIELVRGTPLVLQLYVIFFLLPEIGISIHAFWAAVMGLAINYSAYEAEIYRAGLQAIPRGQMEAALSLGMSRNLAVRRVIIPQATRLVIPPVTNDFIALFKDTAVCSVITVVEVSKEYYIQARSTGAIVELGILTAFLYLAMSYPLSLWLAIWKIDSIEVSENDSDQQPRQTIRCGGSLAWRFTLRCERRSLCLAWSVGKRKSTLLRTINGLEGFDSGTICVDEILLDANPGPLRDQALARIRRRVGMVFQQFNLFPHRTVLENVIEGPIHVLKQSREQAVANARQLLQRVGMAHKEDESPTALSGGQQQRVAIARTLAMKPDAILFDEPTSALDPQTTSEVISVMADLATSGQGMIVVTHAMGFARSVADRVAILNGGQIIETGPPEQIFSDPRSEFTRQFLASVST
ncbi:MAG: amino acid ABC transporter permease/ATP-binding protein [Pirellulaceae bacterium]